MLPSLVQWFRKNWVKCRRSSKRTAKRKLQYRFLAEQLEPRLAPSVTTVAGVPIPIPLGNVTAGQFVELKITFNTTDVQGDYVGQENEPVILQSSGGFSQTVSSYGVTNVEMPITQDGETLTAYINDYDADETATIEADPISAEIDINGTEALSDNIALFNSGPLPSAQTIPATITNTGTTTATFDLSVEGNDAVDLSEDAVTLDGGESTDITITPTAVSAAPYDVHIVAKYKGNQVAEDDMTVVSVAVPQHIRNDDTPADMDDRIPPRVDTPIDVTITPDLSGSGQSVNLYVQSGNGNYEGVTIDGQTTKGPDMTSSDTVDLSATGQTNPGDDRDLSLAVQVGGQTTVLSNGFSVAAIPIGVKETAGPAQTEADFNHGQEPAAGFDVNVTWQSDSGNVEDLDEVQFSEVVSLSAGTGVFASLNSDQLIHGTYLWLNGFTLDNHTVNLQQVMNAVGQGETDGEIEVDQVHEFWDHRTDSKDIPVPDSGYIITHTAIVVGDTVEITTTKEGAAGSVGSISTGPGETAPDPIELTQDFPVDPLAITTEPPANMTASDPFNVVVTAENPNLSVNTSFNGVVTLLDNSGGNLLGTLTATAVNGVATFTGLSETIAGSFAITASANGLPSVDSDFFTVNPGSATTLMFTPLDNVLANSTFTLTVNAVDSYGNIDPNFNGDVTVNLLSNPNGATLGGTLTQTAVDGTATFDDLTLDKIGSGYTLDATAAGFPTAILTPLAVEDQLVVTTQPPDTVAAGAPFGFQGQP
jgi:hypothetical protein